MSQPLPPLFLVLSIGPFCPGFRSHITWLGMARKFTVTKYTIESPDGQGVLCAACQKEAVAGDSTKAPAPTKRKRAVKSKNKLEEERAKIRVKSLQRLCIEVSMFPFRKLDL